ncbi:UDP glycosyltransferase [Lentzea sp. NBRC 105346]|uniref:macrolide family glycosyltransferase n=1 Tax=Lentzea sp. NBRC 105346 TaxID=3032205 RepID=UPI0024A3DCA2|nr:macrolide family glycosyltransferase [Lentzea sp. NBRC 105346]GLZ30814.1 UDP glycosyltransferase [Lentzea sp. NBRC 105346]
MAHIAVFVLPERGHVYPVLGLLAELVRRGHRVSCPVTDRFTDAVRSTGACPVRYESTIPEMLPPSLYDAARLVYEETVTTLPVLGKAFEHDLPDMVLWDIGSWAGALIARRHDVPDIQLATILSSNQVWSLGQAGVPVDWGKPEVMTFFTDVHALVGGPLPEFMSLSRRRIALFPREFQYEGDSFDDRFAFVGPCVGDRGFQGSWTPRNGGDPVVLASLGGFEHECVGAVEGMPWHMVVVGRPPMIVPPNVEVHACVPQVDVLAHAGVFLTNGGMSGVMEALVHGVPMIVVPRMADQALNGMRVEELGLGVLLDPDAVSAESLRSLAHQVMADPAITARLKDMQAMIQLAGGASAAAEVIEAELR